MTSITDGAIAPTDSDDEVTLAFAALIVRYRYSVPVPVIMNVLVMFVGTIPFTVPLVTVSDVPETEAVNGAAVCCETGLRLISAVGSPANIVPLTGTGFVKSEPTPIF